MKSVLYNIAGRLEGLAAGLSCNSNMKEIVTILRDAAENIKSVADVYENN